MIPFRVQFYSPSFISFHSRGVKSLVSGFHWASGIYHQNWLKYFCSFLSLNTYPLLAYGILVRMRNGIHIRQLLAVHHHREIMYVRMYALWAESHLVVVWCKGLEAHRKAAIKREQ